MSQRISITLDDEVLEFIDQCSSDRSQFINSVIQKAKQQSLQPLADAYKEQSDDPDFWEEIKTWDVTVGDGLIALPHVDRQPPS
jgi:hypothetical protein